MKKTDPCTFCGCLKSKHQQMESIVKHEQSRVSYWKEEIRILSEELALNKAELMKRDIPVVVIDRGN